jgi:alpha-glucoside transport system permease protein
VLTGNGFDSAFVNTLIVSVPATVMPITMAAFAAYAFSWMEFKGRYFLFVVVVALLVVPLQVALIPILRLYAGGPEINLTFLSGIAGAISGYDVERVTGNFPLNLNGTFLGVWLAHMGFGLPLAIYLLRNFMGSLPSELIESARIDGADHFAIFRRLIIPLSVPALASFAIFQFLWVFNDFLVALVFLGETQDVRVLTIALNSLNGQFQNSWHLLTAGAFISMVLPVVVFFSLQRYFVRGLTAGAVKG